MFRTFTVAMLVAACAALLPSLVRAEEVRGQVDGQVITVGEDRVVVSKPEGGQMTLEANWVQVQGQWVRNPSQLAFFRGLTTGQKVTGIWRPGDGGHIILLVLRKVDAEGKVIAEVGDSYEPPRRDESPNAQIKAMRDEIAGLRAEIAQLKALIQKLVEK